MKIKICIVTMAMLSLFSAAVLAGCGNTGNDGSNESVAESVQSSVSESSEEPSETESTDNSTTDESKTESSSDTVTSVEESRPESSSEVDSSTETSVDGQSSVTDKSDNSEKNSSNDDTKWKSTLDDVKKIISEYDSFDEIYKEIVKILPEPDFTGSGMMMSNYCLDKEKNKSITINETFGIIYYTEQDSDGNIITQERLYTREDENESSVTP